MGTTVAVATTPINGPYHSFKIMHKRLYLNRAFSLIYIFAILALFYYHIIKLFSSNNFILVTIINLCMLISDIILAFMWFTSQSFRTRPIAREEFPEMLENFEGFPALDVFICTADPYREPPGNVANTALSVLAYDYPTEKLSIYVSDDGGSELTLFALAEAARFAKHWLPFCRENGVVKRCPDAYFSSDNFVKNSQSHKIKMMYENMISRICNVVERGKVNKEYISKKDEHQAYTKYSSDKFSTNHHPSIIQVLLANNKDKDITDVFMPNLVYISRQKSKTYPHHFKAGALNVLLRVSRIMTNGPIILTLDCDMYSNDPSTPKRALCYFLDQSLWPNLAYVQTPQRFHGLNSADIYASEFRTIGRMNPLGMDGLCGPNHMGTGCFFRRRAFFGGPSSFVQPEIISGRVANKPIEAQTILEQAHQVASCNYENQTSWGYKTGVRYGSLVEDIHTGYHLHCEGWKSIFCNPKRPAFLGHVPLSLNDVVIQIKRWSMGLLEIAFSKYSPIIFGMWHLGPIMAQCYTHYAFWPIYAIPVTLYAFVPQLALLCGVPIFPKISCPWSLLPIFLFIGAYMQDYFLNFASTQGSLQRWWSDQRMWIIRGLSPFPIGIIEYLMKCLGLVTQRFSVTSKVVDPDQGTRYDRGIIEFGVASPMFVPLTTSSIVNLMALFKALLSFYKGENFDGLLLQTLIACFGVINCLPIYEAMVIRVDKGRMNNKITIISIILALYLYISISYFLVGHM